MSSFGIFLMVLGLTIGFGSIGYTAYDRVRRRKARQNALNKLIQSESEDDDAKIREALDTLTVQDYVHDNELRKRVHAHIRRHMRAPTNPKAAQSPTSVRLGESKFHGERAEEIRETSAPVDGTAQRRDESRLGQGTPTQEEVPSQSPPSQPGSPSAHDSIQSLWSRYRMNRSKLATSEGQAWRRFEREAERLRDRLIINYSPLVKYVSLRVGARTTGAVDREDLMSWGMLGLLDAIETFSPDREVKFETYAISKIRWTILDELRGQANRVSRRDPLSAQEVAEVAAKLTQKLGHPPTEAEIIEGLGVEVAEYRRFLDKYCQAQVDALLAQLDVYKDLGIDIEPSLLADSAGSTTQSLVNLKETRQQLVSAMEELSERERVTVTHYFYEGLTLKEISKSLRLTEGQISQILREALLKMREQLTS